MVSVTKTYLPLQLEKDIPPTLVSYRTRAAKVQYSRLSTTARAVSIFLHSNTLYSPPLTSGSKRPSGRSAPCSGCGEIAGSRSVRQRMLLAGKTRQNLYGHTIHLSHTKSPVAYSPLYLMPGGINIAFLVYNLLIAYNLWTFDGTIILEL